MIETGAKIKGVLVEIVDLRKLHHRTKSIRIDQMDELVGFHAFLQEKRLVVRTVKMNYRANQSNVHVVKDECTALIRCQLCFLGNAEENEG